MAQAVKPIVPGIGLPVTVYGENQKEYTGLPTFLMLDGTTLSRWRLTWRERLSVLFRGDVYLWMLTFNRPLQPVMIQIERPNREDLARSQEYARRQAEAEVLPLRRKLADCDDLAGPLTAAGKVTLGLVVIILAAALILVASSVGRAESRSPSHTRRLVTLEESRLSTIRVFGDARNAALDCACPAGRRFFRLTAFSVMTDSCYTGWMYVQEESYPWSNGCTVTRTQYYCFETQETLYCFTVECPGGGPAQQVGCGVVNLDDHAKADGSPRVIRGRVR